MTNTTDNDTGYNFPAGSSRHWDEVESVWIVTLEDGRVVLFGNVEEEGA